MQGWAGELVGCWAVEWNWVVGSKWVDDCLVEVVLVLGLVVGLGLVQGWEAAW